MTMNKKLLLTCNSTFDCRNDWFHHRMPNYNDFERHKTGNLPHNDLIHFLISLKKVLNCLWQRTSETVLLLSRPSFQLISFEY